MHILIVGCGLGGLACAIAARHEGVEVTILEQGDGLNEVGAGIQIPPNAARVMSKLGIMDRLVDEGRAVKLESNPYSRYTDGKPYTIRPGSAWAIRHFGFAWYVIHRADYRQILVEEAIAAGVEIRFSSHVVDVDCQHSSIKLGDGAVLTADAVIGADGLNSIVRTHVLGYTLEPVETGDLAYRATISKDHVKSLDNLELLSMLSDNTHKVWLGPGVHAVLYPVRGGEIYNLVLAVPDDLPPDVTKVPANIDQMRKLFEGWDPQLRSLIAEIPSSLKWKLVTFDPLDTWTRGAVALLGDACHPTLPYQAQGAAMAVEDGACLGKLLGLAAQHAAPIPTVLQLYERLRKDRTTLNVKGAYGNQSMYHASGEAAEERNRSLKDFDWDDPTATSPYYLNDMPYQKALLAFDCIADAEDAFDQTFVS